MQLALEIFRVSHHFLIESISQRFSNWASAFFSIFTVMDLICLYSSCTAIPLVCSSLFYELDTTLDWSVVWTSICKWKHSCNLPLEVLLAINVSFMLLMWWHHVCWLLESEYSQMQIILGLNIGMIGNAHIALGSGFTFSKVLFI